MHQRYLPRTQSKTWSAFSTESPIAGPLQVRWICRFSLLLAHLFPDVSDFFELSGGWRCVPKDGICCWEPPWGLGGFCRKLEGQIRARWGEIPRLWILSSEKSSLGTSEVHSMLEVTIGGFMSINPSFKEVGERSRSEFLELSTCSVVSSSRDVASITFSTVDRLSVSNRLFEMGLPRINVEMAKNTMSITKSRRCTTWKNLAITLIKPSIESWYSFTFQCSHQSQISLWWQSKSRNEPQKRKTMVEYYCKTQSAAEKLKHHRSVCAIMVTVRPGRNIRTNEWDY